MMNLPAADDEAPPPPLEVDYDDDEGNEPFPLDFPEDFAPQAPEQYEGVETPEEEDATEAAPEVRKRGMKKRKRGPQLSQFGIEYPPLPPAVVKRLAQTFAQTSGVSKTKITPDTLDALCQASDWFFEQLGDSLRAYAQHAGRKTIDETDVVTLMQRLVDPMLLTATMRIVVKICSSGLILLLHIYRQRQIGASTTPFSLAQQHLPRELLQHIRMPVPVPVKRRRKGAAADDDS